jgi:hypothetical protein
MKILRAISNEQCDAARAVDMLNDMKKDNLIDL